MQQNLSPSSINSPCLSNAFSNVIFDEISFGSGPRRRGLLNLSKAHIECAFPGELCLKTGRLLSALIESVDGLTKLELIMTLFPEYEGSSAKQQRSLSCRTDKIIQRARARYRKFGIGIQCTRNIGKFAAVPVSMGEIYLPMS